MNFQKFTTFKTILIALVLTINANQLFAQATNGIFFQAVARDNFSNPAKDRKIYVQSSIIQTTTTGTKVLTEEHQSNTDATGVFSISLGNGVRVGGTASNLTTIDWSKGPFYLNLKVAITPIGGNSNWDYNKEWVDMGTTSFGAVPFALYSASSAKVDDKLNVSDTSTMLKAYAKAIKVQSLETAVASKLTAADTLTMLAPYAKAAYTIDSNFFKTQLATKLNLADSIFYTKQKYTDSAFSKKLNIADSSKYVTPTQLASYNFSSGGSGVTLDTSSLSNRINLKANTSDVSNSLSLKADASDVTTALNLKANSNDVASALASKANTSDLSTGLALKINASEKGVANGIATLNSSGIIPSSQLPPVTLSSTNVVASDADMTALSSATVGSIAIRTDLNKNYVLSALPASTLGNWVELLTPAAPVQTVNGYTGAINLSKADINLGDVDNTSDATKPVSTATQAALDLKLDANKVGVASGVASLNALGKVPTDQIPAISFSSVKVLSSQADMLALSSAVVGSVVIRTDVNKNYVLAAVPASTLGNWIELLTPAPPVQTVNGMSGSVNITKASISLGNVDNTSDANKPISTLTQNALNLKAPLASPTFTGTVTTGVLNTSNINATSINTPIYASTPQTLTDASTINWNPALGLNASVTLGGNRALSFTSTPAAGSYGTLVVTQDATGGRTITLPNTTNKVLKSSSTTSIALSSVPGAKDIINFYYDGTYCYWNIGQGYGVAAVSSAVNTGNLTGTVSVANGGTGASTLTGLVKGNGTSAFTTAVAGTDYLAPNGSAANLTNFPILNQNTTGNAATVTTNANLTGDVTSVGNATTIGSGKVTNSMLAGSIDLTSKVTGILPVANGGTGATTLTGYVKGSGTSTMTASASIPVADVSGAAPLASPALTGTPTAPTATSGNNTTQIATTAFVTSAISTVNASTISGTVAIAKGGTGLSTTPANGQIDIGNGTGFTRTTLTAGSGISITNAAGAVTIASSGGSGVPYTGATSAVDLGAYDLKVNGLTIGKGGGGNNNYTNTVIGYLAKNGSNGAGGGNNNTAVGSLAGRYLKDGENNTAFGYSALANTVDPFFGNRNTAIGAYSLANNSYNSTSNNTAVGYNSLLSTRGDNNVALGNDAGASNTTGTYNTLIGPGANVGSGGLTNATAIGASATVSASHTIQLGNNTVTTIGGAVPWSSSSDIRLKKDIVDTKYGLNTVMQFRPVDYTLIGNNLKQVGFIAQEMKKLVPEVVTGFEGDLSKHETLSLTYENLVAVLTKAIQEQQEIINNLQKENNTNTEAIKKLTQQVEQLVELIKK
jgi:hypothetical protein